jgi:pyruvate dehydrogenase E1 component alpha subunit
MNGLDQSDDRVLWLRRMIEIRLFEDRVQELYTEGLIEGTTHLCQGQEAVAVGAIAALEPKDRLVATYRCHGQALARGMPMREAFAELMGRQSGCCHGVGGSMHLTDHAIGLLGSFAIVGAGLPVAVGAALSAKMRGEPSIAVSFCGEAATNIGTFHESLNMAAVWKAPVVFIVENNLYGEYSPINETTAVADIAERAKAHDIPGVSVDGQDVTAVRDSVAEAAGRARGGGGPTLIEAKTYRFRGHSRTDPARYRPPGELERWLARDPITLLADRLEKAGTLKPGVRTEIEQQTRRAVDEAARQAADGPVATMAEMESFVYAD